MLSTLAMEEALTPLLAAGMDALRTKSILMTDYASFLTDGLLAPLGFSLGSPRDSAIRGSHISIRHEEGYRINRALIDEMNVIPDFREPDNIRLGLLRCIFHFQISGMVLIASARLWKRSATRNIRNKN